MSNTLEVAALSFPIIRKYVLGGNNILKILKPTREQVIYYGYGEMESGIGINHLKMLSMLPKKLHAEDIGLAAVLMNRPFRPPIGITLQTAGETLMSHGYQIDKSSLLWTLAVLNEMLQLNSVGFATLEQ